VNTIYMFGYFIGGATGTAIVTAAASRWAWTGVCTFGLIVTSLAIVITALRGSWPHRAPAAASPREPMIAESPGTRSGVTVLIMLGLIGLLLVVWLAFVILGFVIKGLVWLAIIGIVLFLATGALGLRSRR
jgi:hypothetical protein